MIAERFSYRYPRTQSQEPSQDKILFVFLHIAIVRIHGYATGTGLIIAPDQQTASGTFVLSRSHDLLMSAYETRGSRKPRKEHSH